VPEVAAGAAYELEAVRKACAAALDRVRAADPDLLVMVGAGSQLATFGPGSVGSFAGFEVAAQTVIPGSHPEPEATLPLSLAVGSWLLGQRADWPSVRAEEVPLSVTAGDADALGQRWATGADRVSIVAMGDGSAGLTVKAPGYLVEGAELWQKRVTQALVDVDIDFIAAIEAEQASRFAAAGRPAWQVLAGAAKATSGAGRWRGELLADESPYGVAYVVATWTWEHE
jgi:hypothetical protein